MPFVIDASVTAAWCFDDEKSPAADLAMDRLGEEGAVAPAIWWLEIRNILLVNERRGRILLADAEEFLAQLDRLPIQVRTDAPNDAFLPLARKHRLTAHDTAYLELALRTAAPLATLDMALARAARAEGLAIVGKPEA